MAHPVFGAAIQYDKVRVHARRFLPGSGDNAMTPFGHMHFPPKGCRDDFSVAPGTARVWFIHEMAHVWQHQQGLCVVCHGLLLGLKGGYGRGARAYGYDPVRDQGRSLCDFNIEQQADLIAHHFDARHLPHGDKVHARRVALLPFYEAVLADFLENPADAALLPRRARVPR